ncbi:MAG: hypothetical protein IJV76_00215, partial [Clostridia bacterium]|nr:hypothetical protein [Clostridia bacterium]
GCCRLLRSPPQVQLIKILTFGGHRAPLRGAFFIRNSFFVHFAKKNIQKSAFCLFPETKKYVTILSVYYTWLIQVSFPRIRGIIFSERKSP